MSIEGHAAVLALLVGLVLGGFIGIIVACLCRAAGDYDRDTDRIVGGTYKGTRECAVCGKHLGYTRAVGVTHGYCKEHAMERFGVTAEEADMAMEKMREREEVAKG